MRHFLLAHFCSHFLLAQVFARTFIPRLASILRRSTTDHTHLASRPGPHSTTPNRLSQSMSATVPRTTLWRLTLATALMAAAAPRCARAQAPAGAVECSIQSVFSGLSAISADTQCRAGCNSNSGDCSAGWTPGAADTCSAACGHVFEPFWDSCGEMLTNAHMGGMEGMSLFYDGCLETLYPPGACGSPCNDHTFACYLAEVQEACCDEGGRNCVSGEDVPETCPVGCAIVRRHQTIRRHEPCWSACAHLR